VGEANKCVITSVIKCRSIKWRKRIETNVFYISDWSKTFTLLERVCNILYHIQL